MILHEGATQLKRAELPTTAHVNVRMPDETPAYMRAQAERCRRLANATNDDRTARTLLGMAEEYEQKANELTASYPGDERKE